MSCYKNYKSILKQSSGDWMFLSPNSFGEVFIACSFAKSFMQQHGGPITLCVRDIFKDIPNIFYPNRFKSIITMDMETMRSFSDYGFIDSRVFKKRMPINLSPLHYQEDTVSRLHRLSYLRRGFGGLSITDAFRYMLNIDWNAPIEKPYFIQQTNPQNILRKLGLANSNYILLLPSNNTTIPAPPNLFLLIAQKFIKMGYNVISNSKGGCIKSRINYPPEVLHYDLSLSDAIELAWGAHSVIGGGNGLITFLQFYNSQKDVGPNIHMLLTDKICTRYDLLNSDWPNAFVNTEFEISSHGWRELVTNPARFTEWKVSSNVSQSDIDRMSDDITCNNKDSDFAFKQMKIPNGCEPIAVDFDPDFKQEEYC